MPPAAEDSAAPNLSGLAPSYRQERTSGQKTITLITGTVIATTTLLHFVDGQVRAGVFWAVLLLVYASVLVLTIRRPPATLLDQWGVAVRTPFVTRRTPWSEVSAINPAGRWESTSTLTRRGGARINLHGMPSEAAQHLAGALSAARAPQEPARDASSARQGPPGAVGA